MKDIEKVPKQVATASSTQLLPEKMHCSVTTNGEAVSGSEKLEQHQRDLENPPLFDNVPNGLDGCLLGLYNKIATYHIFLTHAELLCLYQL